ncbi:Glucagon receptor [Galemys pyrenaicus]|uniref:Glucagon receptor n=1 Tax=Galemys pyrenaicus TaxID=202257 RepID=A0A8J5ZMY5_GALPY|nr:Glucagon receptor [Galemys pyrenaicus]
MDQAEIEDLVSLRGGRRGGAGRGGAGRPSLLSQRASGPRFAGGGVPDAGPLPGDVHGGLLPLARGPAPGPGHPAGPQVGGQPGRGARAAGGAADPQSHSKLRCTRNYIHAHLFGSFVLKAGAVLLTDLLLQTRYGQQIGDDLSVSVWLSDGVSGRPAVGAGGPGRGPPSSRRPVARRWPAAGWPRCSCSTAWWPTTAGCWWRACICTACWAAPSPGAAASPSTWASAGVSRRARRGGREAAPGPRTTAAPPAGAPMLFVIPWAVVKCLFENVL